MKVNKIALCLGALILGTLGLSACSTTAASIQFQSHSREDLKNYELFTYQTASSVGLGSEETVVADNNLSAFVDRMVDAAVKENSNGCVSSGPQCGQFEQTLQAPACATEQYLCVRQHGAGIAPGAATGEELLTTLLLDAATGQRVSAEQYFGTAEAKSFRATVEHAAVSMQKANDFYFSSDPPNYSKNNLPAWLPLTDGIHVWFSKYEVAPGADGVVEIIVSQNGTEFQAAPAAPAQWRLASSYTDANHWLCSTAIEDLPDLNSQWASSYPVSVLQYALGHEQGAVLKVTGLFDDASIAAVKKYQEQIGLFADGIVGQETWRNLQSNCESESSAATGANSETGSVPVPEQNAAAPENLVTVPRLIGLGNNSAKTEGMRAGVSVFLRANSGDPSIAAQTQGLCTVIAQSVQPGTQVTRNSVVNATMQCPQTGYANGINSN